MLSCPQFLCILISKYRTFPILQKSQSNSWISSNENKAKRYFRSLPSSLSNSTILFPVSSRSPLAWWKSSDTGSYPGPLAASNKIFLKPAPQPSPSWLCIPGTIIYHEHVNKETQYLIRKRIRLIRCNRGNMICPLRKSNHFSQRQNQLLFHQCSSLSLLCIACTCALLCY